MLCLINKQRAANDVSAVTLNLKLRDAACLHAAAAKTLHWWPKDGGD